jgi:hypothetical protein
VRKEAGLLAAGNILLGDGTMATWLSVTQDGHDFFACPEMGPVRGGYNLSALPNSWEDAKVLLRLIKDSWKRSLAAYAGRRGA